MTFTLSPELADFFRTHRVIFTSTTGRSGTLYLANVLSCLETVACFHEPAPDFSWIMRQVHTSIDVAYKFLIEKKLPQIVEESSPVYIETSHVFCKGFLEPLLDLGVIPDLIVLTRSARLVATSLYQLNTIPGRQNSAYYLNPDDPNTLPLPGWKTLHDYQLCYWECLEIRRRNLMYENLIRERGARAVRVSLGELPSKTEFVRLQTELQLPALTISGERRWNLIRGQKIHVRGRDRNPVLSMREMDEMEGQVRNLVCSDYC